MNASDWIALGAVAVPLLLGVFAWVRRVERRLARTLTFEKHDEICTKNTATVRSSIEQLRGEMDRRHAENREERDRLHRENRETLTEIRNSITGTHKRLDQFPFRRGGEDG